MNYRDLPAGHDVPHDVNALIEIPKGGGHVKYEFDRKTGALFVDRLRESSMLYPVNYGCIPQTLSEDGDPLDILVLCEPVQPGAVIPARPVGVLLMNDEKGHDVKILAVPSDRLGDASAHIRDVADISEGERRKIEHFFRHYKDLDGGRGKWSEVAGWKDAASAQGYIVEALNRARKGPERIGNHG